MRVACTGLGRSLALGLVAIAIGACGGDGGGDADAAPPLANPGFALPTAVTRANVDEHEVGDADWSCLGTPGADQARTAELILGGKVMELGGISPKPIPAVTLAAFPGTDFDATFATAMSDAEGAFAGLAIPVGQVRVGFKLTGTEIMDTLLLNQYWEPAATTFTQEIGAVTVALSNALPTFINFTRKPGTGVLAGAMRDCQHREVSNAIATVSATSGRADHVDGANTFYFDAAGGLPAIHEIEADTSADGRFVVFDLPATSTPNFIQVWGFPTAGDLAAGEAGLKLLAELPSPVLADTIITGSIEPLRTAP